MSLVLTITSLFAADFTLAFLPPSVDAATADVLLAVFIVFVLEICVNIYARVGYLTSVYFLVIPEISQSVWRQYPGKISQISFGARRGF